MFEVNNGVVKIDGVKGKYDDKTVSNPSVRYGRNAVNNYYSYIEQPILSDNHEVAPILDFGMSPDATDKNIEKLEQYTKANDKYINSLPPLEYEYRYMPNVHKSGEIDKDALLGSAYEEMGRKKEISVSEVQKVFGEGNNLTVKPLDINNDGKIDVGEYSTTILAADMLSKPEPNIDKIDGTINGKGFNALMELTKKSNAEAAASLYSSLYNLYNLGDAAQKFKE